MALLETRPAQTGACRSQQLPRSLPRAPWFGLPAPSRPRRCLLSGTQLRDATGADARGSPRIAAHHSGKLASMSVEEERPGAVNALPDRQTRRLSLLPAHLATVVGNASDSLVIDGPPAATAVLRAMHAVGAERLRGEHRCREAGNDKHPPAIQPERHGTHATITRSLGVSLPASASSVTWSPSGSTASAAFSAMSRALPPASGRTVPSEVHVAPCRTHAW